MCKRPAFLALGLVLSAIAQPKSPPSTSPKDALLVLSVLPEGEQMAAVIKNASIKAVTAFCVDLQWQYADGSGRPDGLCRDLALGLALDTVPGPGRQGTELTFKPGETQTLRFANFRSASGSPAVFAVGSPTAVIFEDRTAIGRPEQVQLLIENRGVKAAELKDLVLRLRTIRSAPDPKHEMRSQLEDVARLAAQPGKAGGNARRYEDLQKTLAERQNFLAIPEMFDRSLEGDSAQADYLARHSVMQAGGAQ